MRGLSRKQWVFSLGVCRARAQQAHRQRGHANLRKVPDSCWDEDENDPALYSPLSLRLQSGGGEKEWGENKEEVLILIFRGARGFGSVEELHNLIGVCSELLHPKASAYRSPGKFTGHFEAC